jgi:hypothetical protein
MEQTPHPGEGKRRTSRKPTEAFITCRPFSSDGRQHASDGIMRNISSNGFYIESSKAYTSGTILLMRTVRYPAVNSMDADERPRSICLAEVKWMQTLTQEDAVCFGMGVRYLE